MHFGRSTMAIDTIYKSRGNIPRVFLRGCGVPENFIEDNGIRFHGAGFRVLLLLHQLFDAKTRSLPTGSTLICKIKAFVAGSRRTTFMAGARFMSR